MKRYSLWAVLLLVAVLAVVGYLQLREAQREAPMPPEPEPEPEAATEPRYPIPAPETASGTAQEPTAGGGIASGAGDGPAALEAEPLPALNRSDPPLLDTLGAILGAEPLRALFQLDEFVRRFVVTVDNLPRKKLPRRQLVAKPVAGTFLASAVDDEGVAWTISPENAARYAPYVRLAAAVDAERLAAFYARYYPLFQEAYAELGYPDAYFNDRLVDVIDHLLETPELDAPVRLVRPHVFYQYADPKVEALSAGQKVLIRMGSANAEQIKAVLRALRDAVTRGAPSSE